MQEIKKKKKEKRDLNLWLKFFYFIFKKNKFLIFIHFLTTSIKLILSSILISLTTKGIFGIDKKNNLKEFDFMHIVGGGSFDNDSKNKDGNPILRIFFSFFNNVFFGKKKTLDLKGFLFFSIFILSLNCLVSYFDTEIEEKINIETNFIIKNELMKKFRNLSFFDKLKNKDRLITLIENDSHEFSSYWEHIHNHMYHSFLDIFIYSKFQNEISNKKIDNFIFYSMIFLVNSVSMFFSGLIRKEKKKQKDIINEEVSIIRKEISNISLIDNMGLINEYENKQIKISKKRKNSELKINEIRSINSSIVYELLYDLIPFILISRNFRIDALINFRIISNNFRSLARCITVDYPSLLISSERLINFLSLPEINENDKKVIDLDEEIKSITFNKIKFSYPVWDENGIIIEKKLVFENYNEIFSSNKLNKIKGKNGSGKSTILYLLMGIIEQQEGEIEILTCNKKNEEKIYNLKDLNKKKWRENNISYCSYENLIDQSYGSTGQKQWKNINDALNKKTKSQIWLFDEANNALDNSMNEKFNNISNDLVKKGKIVIFIDHDNDLKNNMNILDIKEI